MQRSRIIAYSAAFIGIIALGSWISLPIGNIPFTIQTIFVLLAGIIMHRYDVIPVMLCVILGMFGLPMFQKAWQGLVCFLGPVEATSLNLS